MKEIYQYVENGHMHTFLSDDEFEIINELKKHWKEDKNIPYMWVRNYRTRIDMGELEELKRINNFLKTDNGTTMLSSRFTT